MKNEVCIFNGNQVSFVLDKEHEMMVNATEMAKIFDKQVIAFLRNDDTKKFISEALKSENSHFLGVKSEEDLVMSKQKSGTWMHRVLALKFAAWLSPEFELWVYSTIESLLFGSYVKRAESHERTAQLQKEMEYLTFKPDKEGGDLDRYIQIQQDLKRERAIRRSLTIDDLNGMKCLF